MEDSVGNVYFTATRSQDVSHRIFRLDAGTRRVTAVAGDGTAAAGVDYVPAAASSMAGSPALDFGPNGDLWFATSNGAVRRIRGWAEGEASSVGLSIVSGESQSIWPGQRLASLRIKSLLAGLEKPGMTVYLDAPGHPLSAPPLRIETGIEGAGSFLPRAPMTHGAGVMQAQLRKPAGDVQEFVNFPFDVVRPPSASVTTLLNADFAYNAYAFAYEGERAGRQRAIDLPLHALGGIASSGDGSVYFSHRGSITATYAHNWVGKVSPDGTVARVAGKTGGGLSGDFGSATAALLQYPTSIALDADSRRLFVVLDGLQNAADYIRVVELDTGAIGPFAGYGSATGDSRNAQESAKWEIHAIKYGPGGLYVTNDLSIERIDPDLVTPTVEPWLVGGDCGAELVFASCKGTPSMNGNSQCSLDFRGDGKAYVSGIFCGTALGGKRAGIALVSGDGVVEEFVAGGGDVTVSLGSNVVAPRDWQLDYLQGVLVDAEGKVYFTDTNNHRLYVLSADHESLRVVAGDQAATTAGNTDFTAGADARFNKPSQTALLPDGSIVVLDGANRAARRYWP